MKRGFITKGICGFTILAILASSFGVSQVFAEDSSTMATSTESTQTSAAPQIGMATVFLTNFIRCRTSFRMLFRLSLTMSLLGCDDLRQELTVKVRLPR